MAKINRVKYFTQEKIDLISEENKKLYDKYLKSCIIKNKDVKETTYKVYENYMKHFMVFLAEKYDNIGLYSDEYIENAVDIMEDYILFCQDVLLNKKKVINTKLSTVSSFYLWSMKRGLIDRHPFDNKLERMKGCEDEHVISHYYLTREQIQEVRKELSSNDKYDIQDQILWEIAIDSANRVGALSKLTLSTLDLEEQLFSDIREKRGKHVEVMFGELCKELIEEWLEVRRENFDKLTVDNLFITKYGKTYRPMSYSTIQKRLKDMGKILGIEDFHAHCTRKTALNLCYDETGDIALTAELANHKSIETTKSAYIKPKSKAELRAKINQLRNKNKHDIKDIL